MKGSGTSFAARCGVSAVVVFALTGCAGASSSASRMASASATVEPSPTGTATFRSSDGLTAYPVGETDAPLPFYEYLPPGYENDIASPALIALHGFDGGGDGSADGLMNLFETGIPAMIRDDEWPGDRPFVVLMPQHNNIPSPGDEEAFASCNDQTPYIGSCVMEVQHGLGDAAGQPPCMTPGEVHDFVSWAVGAYNVDPDRIFLTGLSCGGFATYEYAAEYGRTQVAAIVPISADARWAWESAGCELGQVPIWAFQGDADDAVDPTNQIEPVTALQQCPQPPRQDVELTIYPGVGHDAWPATYDLSAGNDIYAWMLDHAREE